LKNISQWEGLSHILWKIKNVPNHQPVWNTLKYHVWGFGGWTPKKSSTVGGCLPGYRFLTHNPQPTSFCFSNSVNMFRTNGQRQRQQISSRWPLTGQIRKPPLSTPPTMVECRGLTQFLWPKKAICDEIIWMVKSGSKVDPYLVAH